MDNRHHGVIVWRSPVNPHERLCRPFYAASKADVREEAVEWAKAFLTAVKFGYVYCGREAF